VKCVSGAGFGVGEMGNTPRRQTKLGDVFHEKLIIVIYG
jgi:hypothetical protein